MTDTRASRTLVVSLLAGIIGATVALLFAPRSGKETREHLRVKGEEMKRQADKDIAVARDTLDRKLQEGRQLKQRLARALSEKPNEAQDEISEMQSESSSTRSPLLTNWKEEI